MRWKNAETAILFAHLDHAVIFDEVVSDLLARDGVDASVAEMRSAFAEAMKEEVDELLHSEEIDQIPLSDDLRELVGRRDFVDYDAVFDADAAECEADIVTIRNADGMTILERVRLDPDNLLDDVVEGVLEMESEFLKPANLGVPEKGFDAEDFLRGHIRRFRNGGTVVRGRDGSILATIDRKPFFMEQFAQKFVGNSSPRP